MPIVARLGVVCVIGAPLAWFAGYFFVAGFAGLSALVLVAAGGASTQPQARAIAIASTGGVLLLFLLMSFSSAPSGMPGDERSSYSAITILLVLAQLAWVSLATRHAILRSAPRCAAVSASLVPLALGSLAVALKAPFSVAISGLLAAGLAKWAADMSREGTPTTIAA